MLFHDKYNDYTDNELVKAFRETGNKAFVGILYNRFGHLVLGLSLKYLKNRDEAQDAVMQIFSNLMSDLRKHKVDHFKSWLFVYTKNFCLMELRKHQSRLKRELELKENAQLFVDSADPEHLKKKEEQIMLVSTAIEQLNHDQLRCIKLFYFEDRSYNDIAAITGYTANEVKSHIQNGKRNLKIKMEALINEHARRA